MNIKSPDPGHSYFDLLYTDDAIDNSLDDKNSYTFGFNYVLAMIISEFFKQPRQGQNI